MELLVHYRSYTCPYPEPDHSSTCPRSISWSLTLIVFSRLRLDLQSGLFPSGFPTNPVYASPLPHTCYMTWPNHSSRFHHPSNKKPYWRKMGLIFLLKTRAVKASSQVRLLLLNVGNYRLRPCGTLELENVLRRFRSDRSSVSNFKTDGIHTD